MTLTELLVCDADSIVAAIKSREPFHVVTFEIQVNEHPHRLAVHLKGADRKHALLYESTFDEPCIEVNSSDFNFFDTFSGPIRENVVKRMFPTDLSDFYCVQMVRDGWHPCGDFA